MSALFRTVGGPPLRGFLSLRRRGLGRRGILAVPTRPPRRASSRADRSPGRLVRSIVPHPRPPERVMHTPRLPAFESADTVNRVVALLVRFPELHSVRSNPADATLTSRSRCANASTAPERGCWRARRRSRPRVPRSARRRAFEDRAGLRPRRRGQLRARHSRRGLLRARGARAARRVVRRSVRRPARARRPPRSPSTTIRPVVTSGWRLRSTPCAIRPSVSGSSGSAKSNGCSSTSSMLANVRKPGPDRNSDHRHHPRGRRRHGRAGPRRSQEAPRVCPRATPHRCGDRERRERGGRLRLDDADCRRDVRRRRRLHHLRQSHLGQARVPQRVR